MHVLCYRQILSMDDSHVDLIEAFKTDHEDILDFISSYETKSREYLAYVIEEKISIAKRITHMAADFEDLWDYGYSCFEILLDLRDIKNQLNEGKALSFHLFCSFKLIVCMSI